MPTKNQFTNPKQSCLEQGSRVWNFLLNPHKHLKTHVYWHWKSCLTYFGPEETEQFEVLNGIVVKMLCGPTHRTTNPTRCTSSMRRAGVFLALWRLTQCVAPVLCTAPLNQCAAPTNLHDFAAILLPLFNTAFSCSLFLLGMQMSPLKHEKWLIYKIF